MKKKFAILLVLVMLVSLLFTACGQLAKESGKSKVEEDTLSQEDIQDKDKSTEESSADNSYTISSPGVLPIVDRKVDLEVMLPYKSTVTDYEDNKFTRHLEEQTNVHIIFNLLPEKEATDKLNILLSSGAELPDVFVGLGMGAASLVTYGTQGLFVPLNELIDKQGFHVAEMFETFPEAIPQITAPDGNIYALPSHYTCFNCMLSQRFWINKTFMDTLGIEKAPETTEEFYEYLKAVKTNDPNGNGKQDEIPLVGATTGWHQNIDGYLMCAFIYNDSDRYTIIDENGIISFAANQPEWKQGIEYMYRLCNEGLLDPVSFTQDDMGLRSLVEYEDAMLVGACPSGGPHSFANATGERRKNYICIPPLIGPNGEQVAQYEKYFGVSNGMFMISKDCEIPEIAFKWADNCYTEESFRFARYGEEGVDWLMPPEGTEAVNGGQAQYREILKWGSPQNSNWSYTIPSWERFGSDAREKDPNDPYELEFWLFEAAKSYEPYVPQYVTPPFFFTVEEAREYTELYETITTYVKEMLARFVTGDADINTQWETYVQELDNMGVDRYIEIMQTVFERQWRETWD